jgi:hypothetical protein
MFDTSFGLNAAWIAGAIEYLIKKIESSIVNTIDSGLNTLQWLTQPTATLKVLGSISLM